MKKVKSKSPQVPKKSRRKMNVRFKVKLSPKKKEKEIFNPFGLDLSTNV